jgi:hypothetical protein
MYVCMYVCTSVCMYIYVCMYVCMYVRTYVYVRMYNVYLYMYVYMYACMYVSMYVWMNVRFYPSVLSRFPRLDFRFRDICVFYGERSSASRPTPNLEDQGIPFSLDHPL